MRGRPVLACLVLTSGMAVAQPCATYSCDSQVVATILAANGLSHTVESISDSAGGRITALSLYYLTQGLSPEVARLTGLCSLAVMWSELTTVPPELAQLRSLRSLNLSFDYPLAALPPELGQLSALCTLDLGYNDLKTIPVELAGLSSLKRLLLWHNAITSIPADIAGLTQLQILALGQNQITDVPGAIMGMPSLESLILWRNPLTGLSPGFRAWADTAVPGWEREVTVVSPRPGNVYYVGDTLEFAWISDTHYVRSIDVGLSVNRGMTYELLGDGIRPRDPQWARLRRVIPQSWTSDSCVAWIHFNPPQIGRSDSVFSVRGAVVTRDMQPFGAGRAVVRVDQLADGGLRVCLDAGLVERSRVMLHDLEGRRVGGAAVDPGASSMLALSGRRLAPGAYVLHVQTGRRRTVVPVLVPR